MYKVTPLPKSEVKIEFEIAWEDAKPYLEEAAKEISKAKPLPGFRPGHATYEDMKRSMGEMKLLEAAIEPIVRANYVKAVLGEPLETVGSPEVNVDQLVPGQAIKFSTITPISPKVIKLPKTTDCKVEKKDKPVTEAQVEEAIDEMRRMRRVETPVDRPATMEDLVIVDMEMSREKVSLEGGTGRDYRVYLNESHYIPGLTQKLEGIKAGEERTFTLPFPTEHFQKHLAGKEIDFKVNAKSVFSLEMPPVDDAFAKTLGLENLTDLREKLKTNMAEEISHRASDAAEIEMLEKLVDQAQFSEVPEILINEEVRRMKLELQHGVEEQGMKWEDYLSSIKKSEPELMLDLVKQAIRRVQTAVLIKAYAEEQKVEVSDDDIDTELDRILAQVPEGDAETRERVISPDYRDYVSIQMRNRRTLEWLKKECIK